MTTLETNSQPSVPKEEDDGYYETSWDQYQEYRRVPCYICDHYNYAACMEEREDGNFYCDRCVDLPPYSDRLWDALVAIQRTFRARFEREAVVCPCCSKKTLKLRLFRDPLPPPPPPPKPLPERFSWMAVPPPRTYPREPICANCIYEIEEEEREERECPGCGFEDCRCDDGSGWCEKCEGPHGCVCAEQEEDARLVRHRRMCRIPDCDGNCGTLPCGCTDFCKKHCEDAWWADDD
jgi:hypothetical protein